MPLIDDIAGETQNADCPSFMVYGAPGVGKSLLMMTCPSPGIVMLDARANINKPFVEHGVLRREGGKTVCVAPNVKLWDARRNGEGETVADTWPEARRGIDYFIDDPSVKTVVLDNITIAWEDWVQADIGKNTDSDKNKYDGWNKFLARCRMMKGRAADAGKLFVFLSHEAEDKNGTIRLPIPGQPGTVLPADVTCMFRLVRKRGAGGRDSRFLMTRPTGSYYAKGYETLLEEEEPADMRIILAKIGLLERYSQADFAHCALIQKTFQTPFDPKRLLELEAKGRGEATTRGGRKNAKRTSRTTARYTVTRPAR